MRILVAHPGPQFSVHDVYVGWVEALRAHGHDVREFNLNDRLAFYAQVRFESDDGTFPFALDAEQAKQLAVNGLYGALMKFRPHLLLAVSAFFLPPETLDITRAAGVPVVILHTECPYENARQIEIAQHADLNLLNDPMGIEEFADFAPAAYMPHAFRPTLHRPGPVNPELVCDFGFVGTGYPSRIAFFEAMDLSGLNVRLAGNWQAAEDSPLRQYVGHDLDECIDNERAIRLYNSTSASINIYRREREDGSLSDAGLAMGPREVELAACGTFFLRDPRPEGDEVLDMLPTFDGPEDAGEQLRWWLAHPADREAVTLKAREAVADRTFVNNVSRLMRLLGKKE